MTEQPRTIVRARITRSATRPIACANISSAATGPVSANAMTLTGTTLNIFSVIGFIMLMGLVTKNAILVVDPRGRIVDASDRAVGYVTLMRIVPEMRVIEVGHVLYSPALQRTPLGTETQYLLARYIFETLGYRRYEWKCDALNAPSWRAALRYGFVYEGTFRQYMIAKGRNRDNAWFSMLDSEWPARKANFERWLQPENFDSEGRQKLSLAALNSQKA
jgi:hypothetical protein